MDLWRSARYRTHDGGLSLRRARVLGGGRRVRLPAPLEATGGRLIQWRFDRRRQVLRAVLSARSGGLMARGC